MAHRSRGMALPCRDARQTSNIGRCLIGGTLVVAALSASSRAGNIFDDDWVTAATGTTTHPATHAARPDIPALPDAVPGPTSAPGTGAEVHPEPISTRPADDHAAPGNSIMHARLPVPPKGDRDRSRKLLEAAFAKELADASPKARRKLSERLVQEAVKAADVPSDQFVLLSGAIEAGKGGSELRSCLAAADALGSTFRVDAAPLEIHAALGMRFQADTSNLTAENCRLGLDLVDRLAAAGDYDNAARILAVMRPAAVVDPPLKQAVQDKTKDLEAARATADRLAKDLAILKTAPQDPAANLSVGQDLCFAQGKWQEGLPHLVKGQDAELKGLAVRDMATPGTPDDMVALGNDWWDAGAKRDASSKNGMQARGYRWLTTALPQLHGLQKIAVENRLAQSPFLGFPVGLLMTFKGHVGGVNQVAFAPGGRSAISVGDDATIRLWDIFSGEGIRQFQGHTAQVTRLGVPETGHLFITGSADHSAQLWDIESGESIHRFTLNDTCSLATISPDGRMGLIAATQDGPYVVSTSTFENLAFKADGNYASAWSGHGRYLATGGWNKIIHIFDGKSLKEVASLKLMDQVYGLAFTPDERRVLAYDTKHHAHVFDLGSRAQVREFDAGRNARNDVFAFSADSKSVMLGGSEPSFVPWNLSTGIPGPQFAGPHDDIIAVAISKDGRLVLSGDKEGIVKLWRLPGVPGL